MPPCWGASKCGACSSCAAATPAAASAASTRTGMRLRLLMMQCLDRIQTRGAPGRIDAKDDAEHGGHRNGDEARQDGNVDRILEELLEAARSQRPDRSAQEAAHKAQQHGFSHELGD